MQRKYIWETYGNWKRGKELKIQLYLGINICSNEVQKAEKSFV